MSNRCTSRANVVSISKSPDRSFLIDFGSPPISIIALWTTKGDFRAISQFGGGESLLIFRTSLAGLALDSATSSGLGRAPPLLNAGPHPGTTWNYKTGGIIQQLIEQPGHAG
ncbi:hypothetical protein TNCV_2818561 [Trichonephila clavipes]|nr:hypothetical protein TNCV_2818561 [Trichonephila clavipes]